MPRVIIVDYGVGNLRSLALAFDRLGADVAVTADPHQVAAAERVVFPGVGAYDSALERLAEPALAEALRRQILERRTPVLGICLGLQLMARASTEGQRPGLGWIAATVRQLEDRDHARLRVPHLGWAAVTPTRPDPLWPPEVLAADYYFAHSYVVDCERTESVTATAEYGETFAAVVRQDHLLGVQFHPERSHRAGQRLLAHFLRGC